MGWPIGPYGADEPRRSEAPTMLTSVAFLALLSPPNGFTPAETNAIGQAFVQFAQAKGARGGCLIVTDGVGTVTVPFGIRNENGDAYLASTPCRIASVSKTLTATAIMILVQDGKLRLEDRALDILNRDRKVPIKPRQESMREITVRQLLQHHGGWGSDTFLNEQLTTSKRFGTPLPVPQDTQVQIAFERESLASKPGTRFSYSNIGFQTLGRIIEKVSGKPYEVYVRSTILKPAGIPDAEAYVGHSKNLRENETRYWDLPGRIGMSLYAEDKLKRVPFPYGCYTLDTMDASGGWVMSTHALIKFQQALPKLISPQMQNQIVTPPPTAVAGRSYTGLGFVVIPESLGGHTLEHGGSLEGCNATIMFRANGTVIAATFNTGGMPQDNTWAHVFVNQTLCPLLNRMTPD